MATNKKSETSAVVVSRDKRHIPQLSRRSLIVGFFILAVVLVAGGLVTLALTANSNKYVVAGTYCKGSIVTEANIAKSSGNLTDLHILADHIMTINNYQYDANCLYILGTSYALNGDASSANQTIQELQKAIKSAPKSSQSGTATTPQGFSKSLDNGSASVVVLQKQIDQTQQNDGGIGVYGQIVPRIPR